MIKNQKGFTLIEMNICKNL
ncbi:prepilin-type N-terminal cleavage/methylation domain-containing protein [Bacillus salacetis]